ncbi:MAG: hypothetical protein HY020_22435 [Burkholderiales bacterium]|nr:hypothetical protein [Burkholderiales bacterium]
MRTSVAAALLAVAAACAQATTVWQEGADGTNDLSNDRLAPTTVTMGLGHNLVLGTTGNAGSGIDRDYFRFDVPAGAVLEAIVLHPDTFVSGDASFIGIQAGPQVTVTPTGGGAGVTALYGFLHYRNDQIGQNILPELAFGTSPVPAPAGTYAVWVQELGGEVRYGFDFVVASSVPEPAAALRLALGLAGLACRRFVLLRR